MAFRKFIKYIRFLNDRKRTEKSVNQPNEDLTAKDRVDKRISNNLESINTVLKKSDDVIIRNFEFGIKKQTRAFICFIDGLGDKTLINEYVVKPLMVNIHTIVQSENLMSKDLFLLIKENVLNAIELMELETVSAVVDAILGGNTALFIDGYDKAFIVSAKGAKSRNIEEPNTEIVVRGPREGFTETLRVNTALLRKKIVNANLVFESFVLGKQTKTDVNIAYIEGIANHKVVEEVRRRLSNINLDFILESGYIEQAIEDHPLSPFSTIGNSEKPDKVAANLLEGKVAIICSGTPFVLTVPRLFIENFQVSEDYYSRSALSTTIRILRLLAFIITLTIPSLYIAFETFHQEMIPATLLITAAAAREGIPFPSFAETLIAMLLFELLRESGLRLPKQVGQAVSIVGALVMGEAAVQAGIISAPMVIIVALTGITSFIVPSLLDGILIFRFFLIVLSAAFGLFGTAVGLIVMLVHLCSLRSFGVPFMAPMAPVIFKDLRDSFVRMPLWFLQSKPRLISNNEKEQRNRKGRKIK